MTLTSFTFLLFFPIVFLLHYLLFSKNRNWQNGFVLTASMVFYRFGEWYRGTTETEGYEVVRVGDIM